MVIRVVDDQLLEIFSTLFDLIYVSEMTQVYNLMSRYYTQ